MLKQMLWIRTRQNERKRKLVQDAIKATLSKNGIVVSHATTIEEICATSNYNLSVELPICGKGKL